MSPLIEIRPASGEKSFEPIIVEVSKKVAREIAVDILVNPVELNSKNEKDRAEKRELATALAVVGIIS